MNISGWHVAGWTAVAVVSIIAGYITATLRMVRAAEMPLGTYLKWWGIITGVFLGGTVFLHNGVKLALAFIPVVDELTALWAG